MVARPQGETPRSIFSSLVSFWLPELMILKGPSYPGAASQSHPELRGSLLPGSPKGPGSWLQHVVCHNLVPAYPTS